MKSQLHKLSEGLRDSLGRFTQASNKKGPLRREIFSAEEMAHYAEQLAERQRVRTIYDRGRDLIKPFIQSRRVIRAAYFELSREAHTKETIIPGIEWLLDNYHIIQQHGREVVKDLPKTYYRKLPKLKRGDFKGYPRVLHLAVEFVAHSDSRIEEETLSSFISGYQKRKVLTIGELWAIPIMMRLVLIDNLRRIVESWVDFRDERVICDGILNRILADDNRAGTELLLALAKELKEVSRLSTNGHVYLIRNLRIKGPRAALAVGFIEERLKERDLGFEEVTRLENQASAGNQISMMHIFTSLRAIGSLDWKRWVEKHSKVHEELLRDPAGIYPQCDFSTRDHYRHRIEVIAQHADRQELAVVDDLLELINERLNSGITLKSREAHIGEYLVGDSRELFEQHVGYKSPWRERTMRYIKTHSLGFYLGGIVALTGVTLLSAGLIAKYYSGTPLQIATLLALFLIPTTEIATNVIQWIVTLTAKPEPLPKLDLSKGVPDDKRTLVAVHGIFSDKGAIQRAVEQLEVRFLGNREKNIYYCLMADLHDANQEILPSDNELMDFAKNEISLRNARYGYNAEPRFLLLFRKRTWNSSENRFMGWERKRGKITELNKLIRGSNDTSFVYCCGKQDFFRTFKYVITLDLDTQLPRGSAHKLIGTISHPLNRAQIDAESKMVVRGYGIVQPRVGINLNSAQSSMFSRVFAGASGIDPYTQCVSDVYQDLFSEGSFIGKAIFDVEAFETSLENRVPDNSLLSHDLFEGTFARAGLASDIELMDDFPSRYHVYMRRAHRWVRGDWQLLPWIFGRIPTASGTRVDSPITGLGRWKLFDNLRRSLVAPSMLLFLIYAWTLAPGLPWLWSLAIILFIAFPVFVNMASALMPPSKQAGFSISSYVKGLTEDIGRHTIQAIISLAFLPHQALLVFDAICTTLWRLFVSKKKLLEWETAYHAELRLGGGITSFLAEMASAMLLAAALFFIIYEINNPALPVAGIFLGLWFVSPAIAAGVSFSRQSKGYELTGTSRRYLTDIAWDTWNYFNDHLNAENNFLIPDNLQLVPQEVVAKRTSPTNIGFSMIAVLGACDLGFITYNTAIQKLTQIFSSLSKLERFRGHFLNWYSTERLDPLYPRYVSAVDSGNLAGVLIALKAGLLEHLNLPIITPKHHAQCAWLIDQAQKAISVSSSLSSEVKSQVSHELGQFAKALMGVELIDSEFSILSQKFLDKKYNFTELSSLVEFLENIITAVKADIVSLRKQTHDLIEKCNRYVAEIDFRFLFNEERKLFVIGYNVDNARHDPNYYDLLASEARIASLVAIAKGEVSEEHWFMLGRSLTRSTGGKALLSWSGTMFEYLMPLMITKDYSGTLLSKTYKAIVLAQRNYGSKRSVPWGVSESAYSGVDYEKTYQYRAFGVPGLGLKRGLSEDIVVSPYSTFLALTIAPDESINNVKELEKAGLRGRYGFFESVDFTERRLGRGEKSHVVQSFFAHHQAMSFISIINLLLEGKFQTRFHSEPMIRATEILLQERFPRYVPSIIPHQAEQTLFEEDDGSGSKSGWEIDKINTPHTEWPRTHVLSNGHYSVMVDNSGSGQSIFDKSIALTRWREDDIVNRFGTYIYVRDLENETVWSTTYQPTRVEPERYEVLFSPDKVEFNRRDNEIGARTDIVVSPEDNVEIRRVTVTNFSGKPRSLELTSYGEVVLGSSRGEAAHPAFSNMFVESEYLVDHDSLLFSRRPRSAKDERLYMFHTLAMNIVWEKNQHESSRQNFLGRYGTVHSPKALSAKEKLSGTVGAVLDPIFSMRCRVELDAHSTQIVTFITGFSKDREEAVKQIERYHRSITAVSRAFEMAWSQSSVELRVGHYSAAEAGLYQKLANCLWFNVEQARVSGDRIARNRLPQSGFWRFGISGDLPIVLVKIADPSQKKLVSDALAAHEYLRQRGITFDLVILNEYPGGYSQDFQHELEFTIRAGRSESLIEKSGGIFLRTTGQISAEEVLLLEAVARLVLIGSRGGLTEQIPQPKIFDFPEKAFRAERKQELPVQYFTPDPRELEHFNGIGGFTDNGRSYLINVDRRTCPPLPWSNVISNENFGFLVSESGGGYTWSENSRENRLTPWSNDFVSDPLSEILYIRDIANGHYWSPTPKPCMGHQPYRIKHGFGWTTFSTTEDNISSKLLLCGAKSDRVKWYKLKLKNESQDAIKNLEIFLYVDWVLGVLREDSYRHIATNFDVTSQTLYAVNNYNNEFAGRYVFIGSDQEITSFTTSRFEFIGRNRDSSSPLVLQRGSGPRGLAALVGKNQIRLSKKLGAGFNACGVLEVTLKLEPGEEREVTFFLGEAFNADDLRVSAGRYRSPKYFADEQASVVNKWSDLTSAIQVKSPDRSFDLMLNGWLMYQTVACRMLGRSGFYQSGGALGFRDQLQDALSLLHANSEATKQQILLHASRQFSLGDVQHWWHPPLGRGVRTTISDDLVWLPYAVTEYISFTGDVGILDQEVKFIEGQRIEPGHGDLYFIPNVSMRQGTIYEHCVLAIDKAFMLGAHGLPLIGGGDWNDGMNEVGKDGKGESVWLAWFMALVLKRFAKIAVNRNDTERSNRYMRSADDLQKAIEGQAWDGEWYRRAYFDNGVPLGSSINSECQIDSLAQTWAIISGLGDKERSRRAMDKVYEKLVIDDPGVILLLTPAFDKAEPNPGYIKGYLPGIRENGAQYTHAATWVVLATAMMGRGTLATKLFQFLNPISHGSTPEQVNCYMGEPYVLCGDVYSNPQHLGRAGWSWYTGSSGWMYRIGVEHILGIKVSPHGFAVDPCIPASWTHLKAWYRHKEITYAIEVNNHGGVEKGIRDVRVNGNLVSDGFVKFAESGSQVNVQVELG